MSFAYRRLLEAITRVRGVRGAMLVAAADGLIVAEALMEGVRGNAVAALAASLTKRVGSAADASGVGLPHFLHLQATEGALLAVPAGTDLLLVTVADPDVNVGLARLEMLRAVDGLR
jgi:predicted regulator of Ras-like GTPase activity (Roadblock/LC7/MglB family)